MPADSAADSRLPLISVIIVVGNERRRAPIALRSVLRQSLIDQIEIFILDCNTIDAPPLPGSEHRAVQVIAASIHETFGAVRAQGVHMARAPIVAFLEEHAYFMEGWAEAVVKAHEGPWASVGGEVHVANPGIGLADAFGQFVFFRWLPPARAGEYDLLPGNNTSYCRDILLRYAEHLPDLLTGETAFQMKLVADGYRLYLDPAVKWGHLMEADWLTAIRGISLANRSITALRARMLGWPLWKRALRIVLAPGIPFYRMVKEYIYMQRRRPDLLPSLVRHTPTIFILLSATVVAQTIGLIFGPGQSGQGFLAYETTARRDMPEGYGS
jgi:glycosyltransferase involved in cell wall biosynthesis